MTDWFEFKGKRCTDYGIHVSEQPPLTIPAERVSYVDVPGRPGSLTVLEGEDVYQDTILTAQCWLADPSYIPDIAAWLKGSGKVTFANRQGGFYVGRVANQIPFERIVRGRPHRSFAVNFRCKPFWYAENVSDVILTESGQFLHNPGTVYAEPVITVYGTGDIILTVGSTTVELSGVTDSITVDTPLMEAYSGSTAMNDHMTGEFPRLPVGRCAVSWTGNVTKVVIRPGWRYLV